MLTSLACDFAAWPGGVQREAENGYHATAAGPDEPAEPAEPTEDPHEWRLRLQTDGDRFF